jgi:uncharacterized protein YbbC (DUF1343 family)
MAQTEILITGRETLRAAVLFFRIRFAMKNSNFNLVSFFLRNAKYRHLMMLVLLIPTGLFAQLKHADSLVVAAERPGAYLPLLYGKKVAVVANQTSMVQHTHLVDFLLENKVAVQKVFAPEHGFRGTASAGETVDNETDAKTGLPLVSLYGSNKKPTAAQLKGIELVVFDIQDVGARFYTYISTLTYVMEACANAGVAVVVLDRPNPNGHYVDGPVLEKKHSSFIGLHPVPVVHGLTIGEYAKMVVGEGWIKTTAPLKLTVVPVFGYDHNTLYSLPIPPSPNLPNDTAIVLYPSLCLFEGTSVSVGRGTNKPFQVIGAPYFTEYSMEFTPTDRTGAINPKYEGVPCKGHNLSLFAILYLRGDEQLYLNWLIQAYQLAPDKDNFFTSFFTLLAGTEKLQQQIQAGNTVEEIRASWQADLQQFKKMRKRYLLYPED